MEDDPVIREVPVFLSRTLGDQLYVFQYPMRGAKSGWESCVVERCKIKPVHGIVNMDVALCADTPRYDSSKAEQIAINTDGLCNFVVEPGSRERDKNAHFKSGFMDKIQYDSSAPIADVTKYTVAVLQDGELHVTPLKGILQMRPSFTYFDKQDKKSKESDDRSDQEDEAGPSGESGAAKPVTVSFARTETDRIKKAREKSYSYLTKKSDEEPWCDTAWFHSNSDEAEVERSKLLTSVTTEDNERFALEPDQYLAALIPKDPEQVISKNEDDYINMTDLKKLPLAEQCKVIIKDAKLVTVGWISNITGVSGAPLLTALAGAGRLLRGGRWAARSSLLYPPGSVSQHSGVTDRLMCRARDYVLYLFTQSDYVDRQKVAAAVKLPPEEVKEILSSVATYQTGRGWELFVPPDTEFENKYPDVELRQTHFWNARQRQFNEMLSGEQTTVKRQRKKSQRDSVSSDAGMPSPKIRNNSIGNLSQSSDTETTDERKGRKNSSTSSGGKRIKHPSGNHS